MHVPVLLVLLWTGCLVDGGGDPETHSLTYIYTALSHPVHFPGIHQFTAMGLLDGKMIDYYDSTTEQKEPRRRWMKERLQDDYWSKGTQSRKSKQQWFNVNIDILKDRLRQNDTDLHVLQWMHGCEGRRQSNETLEFRRGMDMYSYDGDNFLSFDDENAVWVSSSPSALQTKRKWDGVQVLKEYTKGYLENECMSWLNKFVEYQQKEIQDAPPPEIFMFAKESRVPENVVLSCLASGFVSKQVSVQMTRDGRVLTARDGVVTLGVRPNEDGTFQRRDSVEIPRSDSAEFSCEAVQGSPALRVQKVWDHKLPGENTLLFVIVVVAGVCAGTAVMAGLLLFLYKRGKFGRKALEKKPVKEGYCLTVQCVPAPVSGVPPEVRSTPDSALPEEENLLKKSQDSVGPPGWDSGVSCGDSSSNRSSSSISASD